MRHECLGKELKVQMFPKNVSIYYNLIEKAARKNSHGSPEFIAWNL